MTPTDPRAEPPDEKVTVEIPSPPPWAVEMAKSLNEVKTGVSTLMEDGKGLNLRMAAVEGRIAKLESPSIPPLPPITSERVRAVVDGHTSQADLEQQAKLAEIIIKDTERDKHIAETRALAEKAATKEDVQALAERAATKEDVKALADSTASKAEVKAIADTQTKDIVTSVVTSVEGLAARNKTVRYLLIALAGLALVAINQATTYLTRAPQPAPLPQQTQQVTK